MDLGERLVLGLVPFDPLRARDPRAKAFVRELGERAGVYLVERSISTYDELQREMTLARIDLAWLPPMLFARLDRDRVADAILTRARNPERYASALVSRRGSPVKSLADLARARVAWVDPLSAAGYLLPRVGLAAQGIDPRSAFAQEIFAGSHAEALRAVLAGRVDVAATFAHLDASGAVVGGPWTEVGASRDDVQVVAILGEVPPDVIAARVSVDERTRERVAGALLAMAEDSAWGATIEGVFGGRAFVRGSSSSYASLNALLDRASSTGLSGASAPYLSTAPPGSKER